MPLYGHEIDDTTTPIEARLMWAVAKDFSCIGGEELKRLKERPPGRILIGFTCGGRRVPRAGYTLMADGEPKGDVRSGAFSPTLDRNIGTAYVPFELSSSASGLTLDLRGQQVPIEITELPFCRRRPRPQRDPVPESAPETSQRQPQEES